MTLAGLAFNASVLELGTLLLKTRFDSFGVAMAKFPMLDRGHVMRMLLRKYFTILHRLDGGVEMVLMDFSVDSGLSLLMTVLFDSLLSNGGSDSLVDSRVMVTSLVPAIEKQ